MATLGRPRDPEVSEAALAAAVRLVVEEGYQSLTMERVADRAGVSKAALYRRWPNKLALMVDAVEWVTRDTVVVPDTGRVRDDIVGYLAGFARDKHADADVYDAFSAAMESDHELGDRCRAMMTATVSRAFRSIVQRAVDRGELGPDADVELLVDLVPALVSYRRRTTGQHPDAAFIERIASQFFSPSSRIRHPAGARR